ncbi:MAG: hypothetical protein IPK26_27510 [Planctomycetes bacterium]|nr:hypothetical protein [Planctomycetota bacterium]
MRTLLLTAWLFCAAGTAGCQSPATPVLPPAAAQEPSLRERAAAAENQGRFSEAGDLWLQLCAQEPMRIDWIVAAGRCLGRAGRFNDALDLLDAKRQAMPGALDIAAMMARTLLLKAERDPGAIAPGQLLVDAAAMTATILQTDANHEDARLIRAQALYMQGDRDGALTETEEAVRRHPHRPGAHVLRGRMAIEQFRRLLAQRQEQRPEGQADADLVAAIDRHRTMARESFTKAAELDATRAFPHLALGDLAVEDGKSKDALQHYGNALLVDPDAQAPVPWIEKELAWEPRVRWFADLLTRYRARGDAVPAKAATLRWHQGRAEFEGAQWRAARQSFATVLTDNPTFVNAGYYAAIAAFRLEDHDGAEAAAAKFAAAGATAFADILRAMSVESRGEVAAMLQFLADRAWQQKRIDHSRDLNHVIACLRDSADAWNNYAFLCRETGQFHDSLRGYLMALEREPGSPQLLNDTGVILQYHLATPENLAKAREYYQQALQAAAAMLARKDLGELDRQRATQARGDAEQNLAKLPK